MPVSPISKVIVWKLVPSLGQLFLQTFVIHFIYLFIIILVEFS